MSVYPGQYKYVVEFEKTLAKGVLNGLTVKDRLHFVDERDAKNWINDILKLDNQSQFKNFKVKEVA